MREERVQVVSDQQRQAWAIFEEYQDVFAAVLHATAPWRPDEGHDAVSDFLTDRLPRALLSYNPERGELRPWLYTVFLNYTRRWRRRRASADRLLTLRGLQDWV